MHRELRPYAEYAHELARQYGINPTVTSVFRSWEDQTRLRALYEAGQSRYPANRPGDSSHNYGLSWDSWVADPEMPLWVAIREWVGWRVPPNDLIHGELPGWRGFIE
jgi:hypothetical protein